MQIEVIEGRQLVSSYTEVIYRVDVALQMTTPTTGSLVSIIDVTTNEDVTTTIAPSGSATIEDTSFLKLPKMSSFTANREYSVRFSFSNADNKLPGEIRLGCVF